MIIIAGLGNIGEEYQATRHNLGFIIIDKIAKEFGFENSGKKYNAEYYDGKYVGQKILLVKPQTYMNNSGIAIAQFANFYKIKNPKNILVFYDDLDLELGRIKIKIGGSSAGHNGIKSIDSHLGTENYTKIRCGIKSKIQEDSQASSFVLSKFTQEEFMNVQKVSENICNLFEHLIRGSFDHFMNNFAILRK